MKSSISKEWKESLTTRINLKPEKANIQLPSIISQNSLLQNIEEKTNQSKPNEETRLKSQKNSHSIALFKPIDHNLSSEKKILTSSAFNTKIDEQAPSDNLTNKDTSYLSPLNTVSII